MLIDGYVVIKHYDYNNEYGYGVPQCRCPTEQDAKDTVDFANKEEGLIVGISPYYTYKRVSLTDTSDTLQ